MQDVRRWGVLTIGTGLGNARFSNRSGEKTNRNGKQADESEKGSTSQWHEISDDAAQAPPRLPFHEERLQYCASSRAMKKELIEAAWPRLPGLQFLLIGSFTWRQLSFRSHSRTA
jgi:hypothetical protein